MKKTKIPTVILTSPIEVNLDIIGYVVRYQFPDGPGRTEPLWFGNENGDSTGGPDCRFWFHTHSTVFPTVDAARAAIMEHHKRPKPGSIYRDSHYAIDPVYVVA